MQPVKRIFKLVLDYFEGDYYKTLVWFNTENVLLGGTTPYWTLCLGREDKLLKFVESQVEENKV